MTTPPPPTKSAQPSMHWRTWARAGVGYLLATAGCRPTTAGAPAANDAYEGEKPAPWQSDCCPLGLRYARAPAARPLIQQIQRPRLPVGKLLDASDEVCIALRGARKLAGSLRQRGRATAPAELNAKVGLMAGLGAVDRALAQLCLRQQRLAEELYFIQKINAISEPGFHKDVNEKVGHCLDAMRTALHAVEAIKHGSDHVPHSQTISHQLSVPLRRGHAVLVTMNLTEPL